jgi:hypothetical protein
MATVTLLSDDAIAWRVLVHVPALPAGTGYA